MTLEEKELTPQEQAVYEAAKRLISCKIEAVRKAGEMLERYKLVYTDRIAVKIARDFGGQMTLGFVRNCCRYIQKPEWIGLYESQKPPPLKLMNGEWALEGLF